MRPKIIILLSAIACIGGIVFFLACKYTYEFKVTELKEKAKETFTEALDKELKNRNINDKNRILHRHDLRRLRSCRFYIRQISVSLDIIVYFT